MRPMRDPTLEQWGPRNNWEVLQLVRLIDPWSEVLYCPCTVLSWLLESSNTFSGDLVPIQGVGMDRLNPSGRILVKVVTSPFSRRTLGLLYPCTIYLVHGLLDKWPWPSFNDGYRDSVDLCKQRINCGNLLSCKRAVATLVWREFVLRIKNDSTVSFFIVGCLFGVSIWIARTRKLPLVREKDLMFDKTESSWSPRPVFSKSTFHCIYRYLLLRKWHEVFILAFKNLSESYQTCNILSYKWSEQNIL